MKLISLDERTELHPQLARRRLPSVPVGTVERLLAAKPSFLGAGSFCRVWMVERWTHAPSPARGQPVAIKVCSAGFKEGMPEDERRTRHARLVRHWHREVNAHLLLEGQPRVVRAYHTFQGSMLVAQLQLLGLVHQDIKPDNLMVHLPLEPGALPVIKLGDLNGMQWEQLTADGHYWVQRLYLGTECAGPNAGELNYDTYQMGKVLLRLLLELDGRHVSMVKKDTELKAEDAAVKSTALDMLHGVAPEGEPDKELWAFGVVIALGMAWDGPYSCAEDQLRLLPGEAAEALRSWAAICREWQAAGSTAFWAAPANVDAMARLYLRLSELCRLPPLDEPLQPEVHTQAGTTPGQRVAALVPAASHARLHAAALHRRPAVSLMQARLLLAERTAAAMGRQATAEPEADRRRQLAERKRDKPSLRSTAWETKDAQRVEEEGAFLEAGAKQPSSSRRHQEEENAGTRRQLRTRRAADSTGAGAALAAAKRPRAGAAAVAAPAAAPGGDHSLGDLLVLSSKLRLKDVWGEGVQPAADAPQVLGPRQAVAQMLADTIRAAAAGAGGGGQGAGTQVPLRLGGGCALRFSLTSRRSVQFSRAEFLALAQDGRASRRWNAFVGAARAAWSEGGKEGSRAERLRQLLPLLAPKSRR
ncbi:hypothetical protein ABPG77_006776 [Micractinium sp. CCAP 211/92]